MRVLDACISEAELTAETIDIVDELKQAGREKREYPVGCILDNELKEGKNRE